MARHVRENYDGDREREVLEFDLGVRVYPPATLGGYWRIRWQERRRWRDATASSRESAIAKASELVERLARSAPTDLGRTKGADLVGHYLDPARRPPRVKVWSDRHRDEQVRYCNLYVLPIIGDVPCRQATRDDFQQILDQAATPSVAKHLRACLTGLVNAGLEEGHLLVRQDLLRRVRWHGEIDLVDEPVDRAVTEEEIPAVDAVHALAAAAAARSGVWWHELQILLVAYSGMRWGEHTALAADRVRSAEIVDRPPDRRDPEQAEAESAQGTAAPGDHVSRDHAGGRRRLRHGRAASRRG